MKAKINKWDPIKIKAPAQQRKPYTRQDDSPQNGRKYLQRSNKELISKIYKQLMQLNGTKQNKTTQLENRQKT